MSDDLEPPDPTLATLFREERSRNRATEGSRERVLERLETSLAAGSGGGPGGGTPGASGASALGRWLPLLGALAIGGAAGSAITSVATPERVVYVDRVVPAATVPSLRIAPAPSADAPIANPIPSASPEPSAASDLARDGALAAERAILDVARTAIGRGDAVHALEAVNRHAREFPRGQLSEEREAIAVQALVRLGRDDDARSRGARFRKRYPDSVLVPVIDAALGVVNRASSSDDGGTIQ
jgi:hypothetical protein